MEYQQFIALILTLTFYVNVYTVYTCMNDIEWDYNLFRHIQSVVFTGIHIAKSVSHISSHVHVWKMLGMRLEECCCS